MSEKNAPYQTETNSGECAPNEDGQRAYWKKLLDSERDPERREMFGKLLSGEWEAVRVQYGALNEDSESWERTYLGEDGDSLWLVLRLPRTEPQLGDNMQAVVDAAAAQQEGEPRPGSPCEIPFDQMLAQRRIEIPKRADEAAAQEQEAQSIPYPRTDFQHGTWPVVMPPSRPERQRAIIAELQERARSILTARSHDYAHDDDLFSNFRFSGGILDEAIRAGVRGADLSFLCLICTKLARLIELCGGKEPKSEAIADTALDLSNYALLWAAKIQEVPHA